MGRSSCLRMKVLLQQKSLKKGSPGWAQPYGLPGLPKKTAWALDAVPSKSRVWTRGVSQWFQPQPLLPAPGKKEQIAKWQVQEPWREAAGLKGERPTINSLMAATSHLSRCSRAAGQQQCPSYGREHHFWIVLPLPSGQLGYQLPFPSERECSLQSELYVSSF